MILITAIPHDPTDYIHRLRNYMAKLTTLISRRLAFVQLNINIWTHVFVRNDIVKYTCSLFRRSRVLQSISKYLTLVIQGREETVKINQPRWAFIESDPLPQHSCFSTLRPAIRNHNTVCNNSAFL